MIRFLILGLSLCLILGLGPMTARGQTPAVAPAPPPAPPITPSQAQQALEVLRDDNKRAQFIGTLEAIARLSSSPGSPGSPGSGQSATAPPAATVSPPSPVAPAAGAISPPSPVASPAAPVSPPSPVVPPQPAPAPAAAPAPVASPAGTPAAAPAAEPEKPVVLPLAPDSVGAQLLVGASDFLSRLSAEAITTARTVNSLPSLWGWLVVMTTDPLAKRTLLDAAWRLAAAMLPALGVEWLVWRALRRPCAALNALVPAGRRRGPPGTRHNDTPDVPPEDVPLDEDVPPEEVGLARAEEGETEPPPRRRISAWGLLRRMPLVLARLVLELLPIAAFALVAHIVVGSGLGGLRLIRLVLLAVVDAYVICRIVLTVARLLFAPAYPRLRLVQIQDATAEYVMVWVRRIVIVGVFGYALAEAGLLLGMTRSAHDALLKGIGLVLHLFVAIIILQKRHVVAGWIRGPAEASGTIAALRRRTAAIWHWIALFYLVALWLVWAVEIREGFSRLLNFFIVTSLTIVIARVALIILLGTLDRSLRISPEAAARYPGLEQRARYYYPILRGVVTAIVTALTFVILLQFWGLNTLGWLTGSTLGRHLLSALAAILVTLLLALLVWEGVNTAIQRHLAKLAKEAQLARSARLRTLLPLLRTTLLITILVIVVLMILSEIGVNTAPLLAGAGIVGVAIGFGSQKLVQDLITGIFLLLENAMQVGDQVTVSGLSGVVENLSVRTIRLRASDGSVHIIPFSAVTSVTNTNRGIGNAAVEVKVAYDEDTDRVSDVLKEIAAGMRKEEPFKSMMLSDLQLWGVDKVDATSATLAGQIVCTDSGRWPVQREFNRRVKRRFQELGIQTPTPTQALIIRNPGWEALAHPDDLGPSAREHGPA